MPSSEHAEYLLDGDDDCAHEQAALQTFDILLAFQSEKCDNFFVLFLSVREGSEMGFMSGGMVAGSVSEERLSGFMRQETGGAPKAG